MLAPKGKKFFEGNKIPQDHTYHMAWTDTGLKTCIRPAVLTLNPLRKTNRKERDCGEKRDTAPTAKWWPPWTPCRRGHLALSDKGLPARVSNKGHSTKNKNKNENENKRPLSTQLHEVCQKHQAWRGQRRHLTPSRSRSCHRLSSHRGHFLPPACRPLLLQLRGKDTHGKQIVKKEKNRTITLPLPSPPPKRSHFTFSPRRLTMRQGNFYRWNLRGGITSTRLLCTHGGTRVLPLEANVCGTRWLFVSCLPAQAKWKGSSSAAPREAPDTLLHLPAACLSVFPGTPQTTGSRCVLSNCGLGDQPHVAGAC